MAEILHKSPRTRWSLEPFDPRRTQEIRVPFISGFEIGSPQVELAEAISEYAPSEQDLEIFGETFHDQLNFRINDFNQTLKILRLDLSDKKDSIIRQIQSTIDNYYANSSLPITEFDPYILIKDPKVERVLVCSLKGNKLERSSIFEIETITVENALEGVEQIEEYIKLFEDQELFPNLTVIRSNEVESLISSIS